MINSSLKKLASFTKIEEIKEINNWFKTELSSITSEDLLKGDFCPCQECHVEQRDIFQNIFAKHNIDFKYLCHELIQDEKNNRNNLIINLYILHIWFNKKDLGHIPSFISDNTEKDFSDELKQFNKFYDVIKDFENYKKNTSRKHSINNYQRLVSLLKEWKSEMFIEDFKTFCEENYSISNDFIKWMYSRKPKINKIISFEERWELYTKILLNAAFKAPNEFFLLKEKVVLSEYIQKSELKEYIMKHWIVDGRPSWNTFKDTIL